MSLLIEVAFKGNRKDFFLWDHDEPPPPRASVIVDGDRGEDLGVVHSMGDAAEVRSKGTPHGYGSATTTKRARRVATADDVERAHELRAQDEDARRRAQERVRANDLLMKLTDAEWQWDRKKLTLYFTADKRVDFRALVRELASMFRTRIELKQIGVRDEAKRLDGIGRCGRQYCSASWLPELRPVNLGVAKDQRLSLNPSQISGACGRLMCCLRYEHEFYVQSRKRFPKEGKILRTAKGEEKVVSNDIFRERVTLRSDDGEHRSLSLAELHAETAAAGTALGTALGTAPGTAPGAAVAGAAVVAVAVVEEDAEETAAEGVELEGAELEPDLAESVHASDDEGEENDDSDGAHGTSARGVGADEASAGNAAASAAAAPGGETGERKPHRRRGRRGGRRNRPGNRGSRDGQPPDGGSTDGGQTNGNGAS